MQGRLKQGLTPWFAACFFVCAGAMLATEALANESTAPKLPGLMKETESHDFECVPLPPRVTVQGQMYKWRNAQGQWVYSDQPPDDPRRESQILNAKHHGLALDLSLRIHGESGVSFLRDQIQADTQQLANLLARYLPQHSFPAIRLNIQIFSDQDLYQQYLQEQAPQLNPQAIGFYSLRTHEAVVMRQNRAEDTLRILRHEVVHLLMASLFGPTPHWLNEGLAENLEVLDLQAQLKLLAPSVHHYQRVQQQGIAWPLAEFVTFASPEWAQLSAPDLYAQAWALVRYLLEPTQEHHLRALFKTLWAQRCQPFDSLAWWQQTTDLQHFEREWQAWLDAGLPKKLRF
ncbi:protein of unknown function [Allopseudospirillum japonicum]|uniref:DUF4124 domain-containing protein n=1 Tax=Allopseudospirillum japonicum TaxID=64971 RepID=A0A1H6SHQ4_9GAMM|nr:DUF4124 domain-containing protein [Allopseudospirillum japonicum]SEI63305.1 protein of unknown function [Allopseudospirillum japonicum]